MNAPLIKAGKTYGVARYNLRVTDYVSKRLFRLPIYSEMTQKKV